jgi:short-subunit dehydrogenase
MASIAEGRLAGKVALVSGAANGIGRASALRLAREGTDLIVIDREDDPLREVAGSIQRLGRRGLAIIADGTDTQEVHRRTSELNLDDR